MNIVGKWKVKELLFPTRNGMVSYTPENLTEGDNADEIIEVAFAQSWCPLCCLFLIWRDAEQHQFRIIVAQNVNEFGGI